MPELQAQVLEKEESVFGYISYGLKGDSLRWYSPGVFTFEIDSVEERKISEEIVREVIPDTLKTILLKIFQEKVPTLILPSFPIYFLLKGGFEKARPSWDSSFISIRKEKSLKPKSTSPKY